MKRAAVMLSVMLVFVLMVVSSWAAEYKHAGPPAFTIEYPDDADPDKKTSPEQIWAARTPAQLSMQAGVADIPASIELKDYAEKSYQPGLAKDQRTSVRIKKNEPFETADGTKAYYSEMEWMHQGQTQITTTLVVAYKDGKLVYVVAHPWQYVDEGTDIVQSLKFVK